MGHNSLYLPDSCLTPAASTQWIVISSVKNREEQDELMRAVLCLTWVIEQVITERSTPGAAGGWSMLKYCGCSETAKVNVTRSVYFILFCSQLLSVHLRRSLRWEVSLYWTATEQMKGGNVVRLWVWLQEEGGQESQWGVKKCKSFLGTRKLQEIVTECGLQPRMSMH